MNDSARSYRSVVRPLLSATPVLLTNVSYEATTSLYFFAFKNMLLELQMTRESQNRRIC